MTEIEKLAKEIKKDFLTKKFNDKTVKKVHKFNEMIYDILLNEDLDTYKQVANDFLSSEFNGEEDGNYFPYEDEFDELCHLLDLFDFEATVLTDPDKLSKLSIDKITYLFRDVESYYSETGEYPEFVDETKEKIKKLPNANEIMIAINKAYTDEGNDPIFEMTEADDYIKVNTGEDAWRAVGFVLLATMMKSTNANLISGPDVLDAWKNGTLYANKNVLTQSGGIGSIKIKNSTKTITYTLENDILTVTHN